VSSNLLTPEKEREELHKKEFSIQTELTNLRTIIKDSEDKRRHLFIEWADILERQIELGIITIPKNGIANRMAKAIRTRGGNDPEIVYMYKCLPFEYKTSHEVEAVSSAENHNLAMYNKSCTEESRAISQNALNNQAELRQTDFTHFTKSQLQDYTMAADEEAHRAHQACADRHYETVNTMSADQSWQDELPDPFAEKMHIDKPDPYSGPNPDVDALDRGIEKMKSWREKLLEYPASPEDKIRYAKAYDTLFGLWDPFIDDKWRRSWRQWHKILTNRIDYSLHGAMSMSKLETIKKDCFRGVTREQIDAKMYVGWKYFGEWTERIPGLWAAFEHYEKYQQPYLGELTDRMKAKMSHLS
jgi:hypothetical protein